MRYPALVLVALMVIATSSCGTDRTVSVAAPDAGSAHDAGAPDGAAFDAGAPDAGAADAGLKECLYTPAPLALEQTHKVVSGTGVLPHGRAITPEGTQLPVGLFPGNAVMTPDGKTLAISNNGYDGNTLVLVDTATGSVRQTVATPDNWLFYGLAASPDSRMIYAAGGVSKKIYAYALGTDLTAALAYTIDTVDGYPTGLAVSHDGARLYASHYPIGVVSTYDTAGGGKLKSGTAGKYPFGLALSADGTKLYVSNWGQTAMDAPATVLILNEADLTRRAEIVVGKNPEQILDDTAHGRLFVLNSDQETVSVIDPAADAVTQTISLLSSADAPTGVFPLGAALSPDARTLYVAAAAKNTVEVIDLATYTVKGSIPVGWYPTAVAVSPDGKRIFAVNAKGEGSGPNKINEYISDIMTGTVSIIDTPDDAALADLTKRADANNLRGGQYFQPQCKGAGFPVPMFPGEASPIKHVMYILKENRTFDQVMGDFAGAERDETLLMFGEENTPNLHELAKEFVLVDNFYNESEISVQGHLWSVGMVVNDYSERTWIPNYRDSSAAFPLSGVEPATSPLAGFLFRHLYTNKTTFVDWGEITGMGGEEAEVARNWDQNYPGVILNQDIRDVDKAAYVIKRIGEGFFPAFSYVVLPNDHTVGTHPGKPTPQSMVADNDEAVGRIVDAVSRSKYWDSTLIFVTEDDPQDGADHVDAHRTFALVISPWARRGYLSKVHASFASIFATWERMLGVPPINTYDANAAPMLDCFTNVPDTTPYTFVPRKIPETLNTLLSPFAAESMKLDFSRFDAAPGLQKILWHAVKGMDTPFPGRDDD